MTFETERLELIVLSTRQLKLWAEHVDELERELSCSCRAEPAEGHFLDIIKCQIAAAGQNPQDCCWHSFWLLLRRSDRTVVGSADFKGAPDERGQVELGYGLGREFEHQGYMTEAVRAMTEWALGQPGVSYVTAETERDNLPSQRVLRRCGFVETGRGETIWWRR